MNVIRLVIADDHTLFGQGLQALFQSIPDIEVAGFARSGAEAISMVADLQPDVVLMDIQMPDVNGIQATRRILQANPHIGVMMLTMFEDDDTVFAAMRAGARGYILKGAGQEEMLRAIRAVSNGQALFGPAIATRLMNFFTASKPGMPPKRFPDLTPREHEVLELIAQGLNNQAIARRLSISEKTVRNHVSNIFNKLQVADRAQAIIRAREAGMGADSPESYL